MTLTDIPNTGAVEMGELVARLLNVGFPLRSALTIARDESILGGQYIVVGDGGMTVTQSESQTPSMLDVGLSEEDTTLKISTFSTDNFGLGTIYCPHISGNPPYFLSSGQLPVFELSTDDLLEFLRLENVPVRLDDEPLSWSYQFADEL